MSAKLASQRAGRDFFEKLLEISGQNPNTCMQCGYCSAACPMVAHMEITPRMVLRLLQLQLKEELQAVQTYWVCSSCQQCYVNCPREIDIPCLMEALRLMRLRQNLSCLEPSPEYFETLQDYPQIALIAGLRKMSS